MRNKERDKARSEHSLGQKIKKQVNDIRAAKWDEFVKIHEDSANVVLSMAKEHENYTKGLLPFITDDQLLKDFETLMNGLANDLDTATNKLTDIRSQWMHHVGFIKDSELIEAYGIVDQYQQASEEFVSITGNTMIAIGDIANSVNEVHGKKNNEEKQVKQTTETIGETNAV